MKWSTLKYLKYKWTGFISINISLMGIFLNYAVQKDYKLEKKIKYHFEH